MLGYVGSPLWDGPGVSCSRQAPLSLQPTFCPPTSLTLELMHLPSLRGLQRKSQDRTTDTTPSTVLTKTVLRTRWPGQAIMEQSSQEKSACELALETWWRKWPHVMQISISQLLFHNHPSPTRSLFRLFLIAPEVGGGNQDGEHM